MMERHELMRLYDQKLQALRLWAQSQGLSCQNCKHQDKQLYDAPCVYCRMCNMFEPCPEWVAGGSDPSTDKYIRTLESSLYDPYVPRCYDCQYYDDISGDDYDCPINPNHGGPCEDFTPDAYCAPTPAARLEKLLHDLVDRLHAKPQDVECRAALEYFLFYQIKD